MWYNENQGDDANNDDVEDDDLTRDDEDDCNDDGPEVDGDGGVRDLEELGGALHQTPHLLRNRVIVHEAPHGLYASQ